MGNGINKVLPNLYLGNFKGSDESCVAGQAGRGDIAGILHKLAKHESQVPQTHLSRPENIRLPFKEQNLIRTVTVSCFGPSCCTVLETLVFRVAGVSRSVTLVVAYIMTVTGRGWVESLAAVRAARPCAGPNLGFLRQLEEFENAELTEVSDTREGGRGSRGKDDPVAKIPEAPRYVTDLIPYSAPEVTKVILTTTPVSQSPLFFLH
ncbi:putative dual specificity protein phosphatase 22 [Scophthalmus maximus]|uniref:Putative dual specificity protein phosphatase 22 n=1 Tax=Scophthalmus maximus TaxID=52904 RepID=A0A2U9C488_SCOMX|nr:putative dual specificity protein phosphatase 22 [Scophthalmus maximus]